MKKYSKKYKFQKPKKLKTTIKNKQDELLHIKVEEQIKPTQEIKEPKKRIVKAKEEKKAQVSSKQKEKKPRKSTKKPIISDDIYTGPINEETEFETVKPKKQAKKKTATKTKSTTKVASSNKKPRKSTRKTILEEEIYTGPINEETIFNNLDLKEKNTKEIKNYIIQNHDIYTGPINEETEFETLKPKKHYSSKILKTILEEDIYTGPINEETIEENLSNDSYYGEKGFYHKPKVIRVQKSKKFDENISKTIIKICNIEKYFGRIYHCNCSRQHTNKETVWRLVKKLFSKEKQPLFDFEEFSKNVKYKEFSDGSRIKIAAEINDIHLSFTNPARPGEKNKVLRGPSLEVYEGKVHAIIGESGSGKSVITSLLYGLTGDNSVIDSGEIKLYNNNVENFNFNDWEKSHYRGRVVSAVFQNPMSTLNPTMKVGAQIMEGMLLNKVVKNKKEAYLRAVEFLKLTKINDPEAVMKLYPHEMSGGMIQRVVIAAIVALEPKILVMDEPTTALDPTVQALVLDVIKDLQEKLKLSIVFITHDLGVVASIADYISIMYAGQIIEEGTAEEILNYPQHPYTWGLISSMPDVNKGSRLATIRGSVPSNLNKIKGDAFAVRNDYALGKDFDLEPDFYWISETHRVKSALLDDKAQKYYAPKLIQELWKEYLDKHGKK
ncbi:dipeptide/oligopeptide/nickel ABC transporter ATP-binding protein DppD/OppD [Mycoplasmopsis canis PG 14]|uniref:ABC transporter ATP-binding protein n=1 Tax=Mycoplasmopsis canis TaxID=29555 RepID=A0A449AQT9_9BACT|nr:ABC transporter ATP-binding protein [Mycoplasmopsis canis]AMD81290.1 peptide ABC transporter ATP-binding protein [Mycoplasmopsis canis PG 14]EIE40567.1 dipeptide/oligopeptide/nickel ABC transporter ATP-binding protein DppD/OppD [Mycoplasmopsis canis PG 14]VEU68736.1 ABC transporter ATP-binding protein [Mycoplasmopsis canis]